MTIKTKIIIIGSSFALLNFATASVIDLNFNGEAQTQGGYSNGWKFRSLNNTLSLVTGLNIASSVTTPFYVGSNVSSSPSGGNFLNFTKEVDGYSNYSTLYNDNTVGSPTFGKSIAYQAGSWQTERGHLELQQAVLSNQQYHLTLERNIIYSDYSSVLVNFRIWDGNNVIEAVPYVYDSATGGWQTIDLTFTTGASTNNLTFTMGMYEDQYPLQYPGNAGDILTSDASPLAYSSWAESGINPYETPNPTGQFTSAQTFVDYSQYRYLSLSIDNFKLDAIPELGANNLILTAASFALLRRKRA
jgi:hypothetical protein